MENTQIPADTPETEEWLKQSLAEIPEIERQQLEANDEIRRLISVGSSKGDSVVKTVTFGDVSIRFKSFMDKRTRNRVLAAGRMMAAADGSQDSINTAEGSLYEALGMLCVDVPYNKASTWRYLDTLGAPVMKVLEEMLAQINRRDSEVKSFLPKR
jgi:hypothetical protein